MPLRLIENSFSSFPPTYIVALPLEVRAVYHLLLTSAITILEALAATGRTLPRTMAALVALVLATGQDRITLQNKDDFRNFFDQSSSALTFCSHCQFLSRQRLERGGDLPHRQEVCISCAHGGHGPG